jgi:23S rRNA-/tRNA-specific pseudouridylate synthase
VNKPANMLSVPGNTFTEKRLPRQTEWMDSVTLAGAGATATTATTATSTDSHITSTARSFLAKVAQNKHTPRKHDQFTSFVKRNARALLFSNDKKATIPPEVVEEMWRLVSHMDDDLYRKPHGSIKRIAPECRLWVSAAEWVEEHCGHKIYVTHRLDQATSGALLFAKSQSVAAQLSEQFRNHIDGVNKRYMAELAGRVQVAGKEVVPGDHGLYSKILGSSFEKYLETPSSSSSSAAGSSSCADASSSRIRVPAEEASWFIIRGNMAPDIENKPSQKLSGESGKECTTLVRVVARGTVELGSAMPTETTIVELVPVTGRTHQLRLHCSAVLRAPILADNLYSTPPVNACMNRLALHAYILKFTHPVTNVDVVLVAPLALQNGGDVVRCFAPFQRDAKGGVWPEPQEANKKRRLI